MIQKQKQFTFIIFILTSLFGCSTTVPLTKNTTGNTTYKNMTCIGPNIYVDEDMPHHQRKKFIKTVQQSKAEIGHFFGGMKSSPKIYACSSKKCLKKFGGIPAKARSVDDKKIILSAHGMNQTTLSHELTHIEFHKRLGSSKVWNKIPMWFDEGLATLACKDKKYSKIILSDIPLHDLVSHDQWVNAVHDDQPAYHVAKKAVETWYKNVGPAGLHSIINHMQKGGRFSL